MISANSANGARPLVYLVAGEPSGDRLGKRLMAALKQKTNNQIEFRGIGGPLMTGEGLDSRFPMAELSVMGFAEVLPRLPALLRHIRETADDILRSRPRVAVTIDTPDFSLRVAKRLGGRGIPLVHYVAPSVWAWKPGRARKMAEYLDHVLTLLPFEPPYFTRHGLAATFVGHPVLESGAADGDGKAFRERHRIPLQAPLICLLPGSRSSEIRRLLPIFKEVRARLMRKHPELRTVLPTVQHLDREMRAAIADWPRPPLIIGGEAEKFDAFAAANAALAASGTVGLELAMAATPHVVSYRMNPFSAILARIMVKAEYVHLVNLVLGEEAVPEFLLGACRPGPITESMHTLLSDQDAASRQTAKFEQALGKLGAAGNSPGEAAAEKVLELMRWSDSGAGG